MKLANTVLLILNRSNAKQEHSTVRMFVCFSAYIKPKLIYNNKREEEEDDEESLIQVFRSMILFIFVQKLISTSPKS